MVEFVAGLDAPVRAEPQADRLRARAALPALLAGMVVAQLAWVVVLALVVVALIP
jgi:hypothetical protein